MTPDKQDVMKMFKNVSVEIPNSDKREMSFNAFYTMIELYQTRAYYKGMMDGVDRLEQAVELGFNTAVEYSKTEEV